MSCARSLVILVKRRAILLPVSGVLLPDFGTIVQQDLQPSQPRQLVVAARAPREGRLLGPGS